MVDELERNRDGPSPFPASRNIFHARIARKWEFNWSVYSLFLFSYTPLKRSVNQRFSEVFRVYRKGKYSRIQCLERIHWSDKISFSCLFWFLDREDRGMQNNQEIFLQFLRVKKHSEILTGMEVQILFRLRVFLVEDLLTVDW